MSRVLLLSTYELGTQPLGLAVPAATLLAAGHDVRAHDLAVEEWPTEAIAWADALACSVPMHTALRIGLAAVERVRTERPEMPVAYFGLYGPVAAELDALGPDDATIADDPEGEALLAFAARAGAPSAPAPPRAPARGLLPPLEKYARYVDASGERLVGAVESTVGCNHRCRHCPVPVVFDGRSRAVPLGDVLADIDAVVALGARHVHFADPDFLNRPQQARRVAGALHATFPDVTFDATIKVSHLIRHAELLPELAGAGMTFVVSAFESTSEVVLNRLDKGHTSRDLTIAVGLLRAAGLEPRPSLLPFTPWTTRDDLVDLLDFVASHDLVENVDGVQYGIRLLLPPGSLLLAQPDPTLAHVVGDFDDLELGTPWRSVDPLLDEVQSTIAQLTEEAAEVELDAHETYRGVRNAVYALLGRTDPGAPATRPGLAGPAGTRPHLTEAWFCCAEPTSSQLHRVTEEGPTWELVATPVQIGRRG